MSSFDEPINFSPYRDPKDKLTQQNFKRVEQKWGDLREALAERDATIATLQETIAALEARVTTLEGP